MMDDLEAPKLVLVITSVRRLEHGPALEGKQDQWLKDAIENWKKLQQTLKKCNCSTARLFQLLADQASTTSGLARMLWFWFKHSGMDVRAKETSDT